MNVFDEFTDMVSHLEEAKVRYALIGGVAMAFYTEPRFTQDIDLLLILAPSGQLDKYLNMPAISSLPSPGLFKAPASPCTDSSRSWANIT